MSRKVFNLSLGKISSHNCIYIDPVSEIKILSVIVPTSSGIEKPILERPQVVDSMTSIQYEILESSSVIVEVEAPFASELDAEDLFHSEVSLVEYSTHGQYQSETGAIAFHEYLTPHVRIENIGDAYISCLLSIRAIDRFNNIVYSTEMDVAVNDDGKVLQSSSLDEMDGKPYVKLRSLPIPDSVEVFIGPSKVENFTLDGDKLYIDIPNGEDVDILYRPHYMNSALFSEVNNYVMSNSNGQFKILNDRCEKINYSYLITVKNLDITKINHTPVIKLIALTSAEI